MGEKNNEIVIAIGSISLKGILIVPEEAKAMVIFSHGSGSSRFSPRNNFVAGVLNKSGFATLLIDLLTPEEDSLTENRFDIHLLTLRLMAVTNFIHQQAAFKNFHIGYFGASTGAASAINAAEQSGELISAIVSRGGRPDLADVDYSSVKAPTLLIVGSLDVPVIQLNEVVFKHLRCEKKIAIVAGATHLFEEDGKLEEVAKLASDWFQKHLIKSDSPQPKYAHHDV